jgi:arsenate reductase
MRQGPLLVLFLSTGNAGRSLLAEALLNAKNSELYRARSAGTAPLEAIHLETKLFLEGAGFDASRLHPKGWQDFYAANELVPVDVIITLSEEAKNICPPAWPGTPVRAHWAVDNPLGTDRADVREWKFRKCFSVLEARIDALCRSRPAASQGELLIRLKDIGMVV